VPARTPAVVLAHTGMPPPQDDASTMAYIFFTTGGALLALGAEVE
jgi:hypothetical protein